ncbi:multicopper oxidase family protein [Fodinibacter luteus]|uniref:Multicopper oxidase family protein n=1 Tax=Fodinibacter luteus TaxID=552064 RepID=A0ABP8KIJ0_9MICO
MSTEIRRRRALQVAALGAASAVVGGVGTWRSLVAPRLTGLDPQAGRPLREPQVLTSRGGLLEVGLTATGGVVLAGRRTRALGYNGTSPGPTLRVAPGDVLRLTLTNNLHDTTNLHTHGLHVSPEGESDDVFRMVEPGQSARYEYAIPASHPTGTFWYHPHHHGTVADQVFGGLFGALVVAAAPKDPGAVRERVLVVSDTTLTTDGEVAAVSRQQVMQGREGELVLVNGQLRPRIDLSAGSPERWRVVNACTSRFLELVLDEHAWGFLGYDGQALHEPDELAAVVLAPGNRADMLVRPTGTGTFALRTLDHDRGRMGMMAGGASLTSVGTTLATVRVTATESPAAADAGSTPAHGSGILPEVADLRGQVPDARRTLTFTMGMGMGMGGGGGGMSFGFDGQEFDPERVDQSVALGTVEEWTIANASPMDHPFHLHVWPMQVVAAPDAAPGGRPDWRDVVVVPARGQVTVRVRFTDFGGRTVYHCHVLDHEDLGMMGVIEARP